MIEPILHWILPLVCDSVWVGVTNNGNSLMDLQHVLLHRFTLFLSNFVQGADHGIILRHITKCAVHALQKLGHHQVRASLQGMHPSTGISSQAVVDMWHHALLLVLV